MRSIEDKGCLNNGITQEVLGGGGGSSISSCMSFEFKSNALTRSNHRTALGKPTPSKWDDAQKWLVNLSRGEKSQTKASPRSSNADDRRLVAPPMPKDSPSGNGEDEDEGANCCSGSIGVDQFDVETKTVDCDESVWRINKPANSCKSVVRSICVRDMGTEMTPIASQEPSRTATPIRATTPAARSPISSGTSTPVRFQNGVLLLENGQPGASAVEKARGEAGRQGRRDGEGPDCVNMAENMINDPSSKTSPLETRAAAWDEAERAKYMARFKREEVKIQAWENHQKRKAEMEMKKVEVRAERLKSRAQEKYTNKLAATRRIAEEKRANTEAELNEKAVRTSRQADYIRRTGHLPSSFSSKFPSFCW